MEFIAPLPIIIAAVIPMIVGFAWYGPLFGKKWMSYVNITQKEAEANMKKDGMKIIGINIILTALTAVILAHMMELVGIKDIVTAIRFTIGAWVAFVLATVWSDNLWTNKPFGLTAINTSYRLVSLLLMTITIYYL